MKKGILLITLLATLLLMTGCKTETTLEAVNLDGYTGKEILLGVSDGTIEVDGFGLSVYDDELIVLIGDERIGVPMPEDEFYVSVAPYIDTTHPCLYHSATGCRGELKSETFFVEYVLEDGTVIISEEMTSLSNGFIDLWLPRDVTGTLTITHNGLSASKIIKTISGEPTCETTMQLT